MEGTLARDLLGNPKEVKSARGRKLAMNAKVDYVSFAGTAWVCCCLFVVVATVVAVGADHFGVPPLLPLEV